MENELTNAIKSRNIVIFTYIEKECIINWVGGESITGKMPPWRLYKLENISNLIITERTFALV